jgi:hypothetical protein
MLLLPGLYAKEVVLFGAPVVVLALWIRDRRLTPSALARAAIPVAAACVLYLVTRVAVLGPSPIPVVSPVEGTTSQILTSIASVARYLPLLFAPLHLSARHEIVEVHRPDLVFAAGLLTLAAIAAGFWVSLRRRSAWTVPLALFAATLLPVCYVRLLQGALVAERFLFVPSAAIAVAVALLPAVSLARGRAAAERGKRGRAAAAATAKPRSDAGVALLVAGVAAAIWLTALLWPRVAVWKNEGTLFGSMLRDSPESPHVHAIVGGWYYKQRDLERSAFHYRRAIRYAPERTGELLLNLGAAEDEMGQHDWPTSTSGASSRSAPTSRPPGTRSGTSTCGSIGPTPPSPPIARRFASCPISPKRRTTWAPSTSARGGSRKRWRPTVVLWPCCRAIARRRTTSAG